MLTYIIMLWIGLSLGAYWAYQTVDWQYWREWLDPWDYTKGLIDGKTMRAQQEMSDHLAAQDAAFLKQRERMAAQDATIQTAVDAAVDAHVKDLAAQVKDLE